MGKLVLGTVQLGLNYGVNNSDGKPSKDVAFDILNTAYTNGIEVLDTAEAYGNSQEVIGAYHKETNNYFKVITKFSKKQFDGTIKEHVLKDIDVLGIDSLHGYMFHNYESYKSNEGEITHLKALKEDQLIEQLGISLYTNEEIEEISQLGIFDFIQVPFNLLDNKNLRDDVFELAVNNGLDIHTRSAFLQGLFFAELSSDKLPVQMLNEELRQIKLIAKSFDISLEELSLGYAISQPKIDKVLIGVDSSEQLLQNISSSGIVLPKEVVNAIDEIKVKDISMLNPSAWIKNEQ